MRVGILSDTHGLLRPEVIEKLEGCDLILHAGDINKQELIEKLEQIAPVKVVRGNNDKEWAENIPYVLNVKCQGLHILMCHKKNEVPKNRTDIDLIVFGHSHKYEDKLEKGLATDQIAKKSCIDIELVQEISRMYLTHPGIDLDGILNRIKL